MKVFDYVHQELSLVVGKLVSRYELWTAMALQDAHPLFNPTSKKAADFLAYGEGRLLSGLRRQVGEKRWNELVDQVRNFDPEQDTPEKIMERLCSGTYES